MDGVAHFHRMARYNRWANAKVLDACASLDDAAWSASRSGFFPSIMATLNHLLVADRLWLSRLIGTPQVMALDTILHADLAGFRMAREAQDAAILDFTQAVTEEDLASDLSYQSTTGGAYCVRRDLVLAHIFNHQTHHRGQVHSMLVEAGVRTVEIDLIYFALAEQEGPA